MERLKLCISRIAFVISLCLLSGCSPLVRAETPTPEPNCEAMMRGFELKADLYIQIQSELQNLDHDEVCNGSVILNPYVDVGTGYKVANEGVDISKARGTLHLTFKYALHNGVYSLIEINPVNTGYIDFLLDQNVKVVMYPGDAYQQITVDLLKYTQESLSLLYVLSNENFVKTFNLRVPMQVNVVEIK